MHTFLAFVFAWFLAACGPGWYLDRPISIRVESPEIDPANTQVIYRAFHDACLQLGCTLQSGDQLLHVVRDPECPYPRQAYVVTELTPTFIRLCDTVLADSTQLRAAIFHEVGRTLGFAGYLPCTSGAVLAPDFGCTSVHDAYTAEDLDAICERQTGGICAGR